MAGTSGTGGPGGQSDQPGEERTRASYERLKMELSGSRVGSVYQRLRNPSTRTGILLAVFAVLLRSAPFIPQWVRTTREGLDARREAQQRFEEGLVSEDLLVPIHVLPYLNRRVVQMAGAESPEHWFAIDFVSGPCSEPHFAQMNDSKYKSALQTGCGEIYAVQSQFAGSCADAESCEIPQEAVTRLYGAVAAMYAEFADAGLVLPATFEEQQVGP